MGILRALADGVAELVFPSGIKCMSCGVAVPQGNTYCLCRGCFEEISFITSGCEKCGKPVPGELHERLCAACLKGEGGFNFERALICMEYSDRVHRLIYSFKYGRKTHMARHLSQIMRDKIEFEGMDFDCIVPVPLSKKRLRKRGFNQARLMGEHVSRAFGKPLLDIAKRERDTPFLSGLSRHERKKELKGVFTLKEYSNNIINNRNILIIDDIFTTGSTINELAGVLKEAGAASVSAICLASGRNIY